MRSLISTTATLALLAAEPAIVSQAHAEDRNAPTELATFSVPPGSLEQGLVALGRQTNLKLLYPNSSGNPALDAEAVSLPRRASPVPAPPPDFGGAVLTLTVPIHFGG